MPVSNKKYFISLFLTLLSVIAYPQSRSLDYFINEGLRNSPLLNDLQNQLIAASIDSLILKASKRPLVEGRSQLLYSPFYKNFGYDEVITDGGNYQAVAYVSQNIFNRKEKANKFEGVAIQKKSVTTIAKLSASELKRAITDQFLVSYSDFNEMEFNHSFLGLMYSENEIVKQFVANGLLNQTDYLSLLIETQGQEVLVSQLKNQYKKDLSLLNQLCGLNDSTLYDLQKPEIFIAGTVEISGSPLFKQFMIDSLKIINEKNALNVRYQPKINWFADAGILTSTPLNFYRHFGYSAGVSLSIPIYDGQQRNMESRKLVISENTRSGYKANYTKQYDQRLLQLNGELAGMKQIKLQLEKQLVTSNQLVTSFKTQLEAGHIQMTEYINAIKNYKNINRNLNIISIQVFQAINEINYLLTK